MARFPSPALIRSVFRSGGANLLLAAAARAKAAFWARRARLAQRRKDWRAAAEFWRKAAERAPADRSAAIGCLSALIYAGDLGEAAERAAAFVRQRPQDENGPVALARIAEARGDRAEGIWQWRAALQINPVHRQALIRLGTALTEAGEFTEALVCAERLLRCYPSEPHGLILQAKIAQQREGIEAAAPLWSAAEEKFGNDIHFLRAYGRALLEDAAYDRCLAVAVQMRGVSLYDSLRLEGQILAKRQPYRDHTDFWKRASAQSPDNVDLTRKLLHAALWARRQEDARTAFERLLIQRQLRASDADYVLGLCLADLENDRMPTARALIRAFLAGLQKQPDCRAAALRLHRLILACFPRRNGAAAVVSRNTGLFVKMIRNARLSSGASEPLEKVADVEQTLAQSGARCFFDSDIDPDACRAFVQLVRDHLVRKQPFSFVRLGDGEANAFQQGSTFAGLLDADAAERERVWWGRTLEPPARADLAERVRTAALEAKALGLPTRELFLRNVRLDAGPPLSAGRSGRGLLVILEALQTESMTGRFSGKVLTSAHLPHDLQRWNLYPELLKDVGEIVLVSCHPKLPEAVTLRFATRTAKHILVPPGDAMREMRRRSLQPADMPPESLNRALDELGNWPENRLVLVGAGYAGKAITAEAARRGGIALDLGSIFDRWLGAHTRSYQDLA